MAGSQYQAAVVIGWQKWLLINIFIILTHGSSSISMFFDKHFDAKISPVNPLLTEGDTLVANCTFKETYSGPLNASDLFFKFGPDVVPKDLVTVLDSRTAQVVLINMTRYSYTALICFTALRNGRGKMQEGLSIRVGVPPEKPVITQEDCLVFNWNYMNCSWQPKDQSWKNYTNLLTESTLHWTLVLKGDQTQFYECPHQSIQDEHSGRKGNMCQWMNPDNEDSFKANMPYYVRVKAENELGTAYSDVTVINTSILVLPDRVKDLQALNTSKRSTTLIWKAPSPSAEVLPMIYKVLYWSRWHNQMKHMVETSKTNMSLDGLVPSTDYTVQVQVKPAEGGFWSEASDLVVSTLPDVPGADPQVEMGGFVVDLCGNNCQHITIYWKEVSELLWHGDKFHYRVNIARPCNSVPRYAIPDHVDVESTQHSATVQADTQCPLEFVVKAVNELGTHQKSSPKTLLVNSGSDVPPGPYDIIANAVNATSVHIEWGGNFNPDMTEVTALWCHGSYLDKKCQGQLNWMSVPHHQSEVTVSLPGEGYDDYRNYLFGLAHMDEVHSSGIQWSDCVFDYRELSAPPSGNVSTYDEPGSLLVRWNSDQDCQRQRGFIINYSIYYCPECDEKCCPDLTKSVQKPRTFSHHILKDLQHRQRYLVWIKSVTQAGISQIPSRKMSASTNGHWFHGATAVGTVIGATCVGILVIAGIVTLFIWGHKLHSWFENLPIKPPEGGLEPTISTSSDLPLASKGYYDYSPTTDEPWLKVTYDTQQSTESNADSGHGSISDQNLLQTRRSSTVSEESEFDEVFVGQPDDMKTQNGYLKVTMLDRVTMSDNGYLKPISPEAVKENGYLKPIGRDSFRASDHRLVNNQALPCVKEEEGSLGSVSSSGGGKSPGTSGVENPGYRVIDIILDKQKSSVV